MSLEKPIFIVGVGRSGSTIFHQAFCRHPEVAWLSKVCDVWPSNPALNTLLMNLHGGAGLETLFEKIILDPKLIKPSEAYHFWEYYCPGFSMPFRDLRADDVTNRKRKVLQQVLEPLTTAKRHRLMAKITGWPRLDFLQTIWPDAKFVHVVRDPRAVVNSMLAVDWWHGWQGPQGWRWGELTPEHQALWEQYDRSFVALAAIELDILHNAMDIAQSKVDPNNIMQVKYEDLCHHPIDLFQDVIDFCELEWTQSFEAKLNQFEFRNTNYKWKQDLTPQQQNIVNSIFHRYCHEFDHDLGKNSHPPEASHQYSLAQSLQRLTSAA